MQFGQDGQIRHQVRGRHTQNVKNGGERIWPLEELGIPVFHEANSYNKPLRNGRPGERFHPIEHNDTVIPEE